jgi:hypothetical protein
MFIVFLCCSFLAPRSSSLTTGSIFSAHFVDFALCFWFCSCVHFVLPSAQVFVFFLVSLALQTISVLFCAPSCQHHCSLLVSSFLFSARELATATAFLSATYVSCLAWPSVLHCVVLSSTRTPDSIERWGTQLPVLVFSHA